MHRIILLLTFLFPFSVIAEFKITGKIVDSADQRPIYGATIFLASASAVSSSDLNGDFTLNNVRSGQYQLIIFISGYLQNQQVILVNNAIDLKSIGLHKIAETQNKRPLLVIPNDEKNYEAFKKEFLGTSDFARECNILNPEVIKLQFDKKTISLSGSSSKFIIIDNQALGYRIKYLLSYFRKDFDQKQTIYYGPAYFEALTGDESQKAKWQQNRLKVYLGSSMHFLRSALSNELAKNGFAARPVLLQVNPLYEEDMLRKKYNATLVNSILEQQEFIKPTTEPALHALIFDNALYVTYSNTPVKDTVFDKEAPATIVIFNKRYAAFDNNGVFVDPSALAFDGYWGQSFLAEMLPVDYEPGK